MWIKKWNRYFNLLNIIEDHKLDLTCLNMTDIEMWMSSYMLIKGSDVDWAESMIDISARLKDEVGMHVVENFNIPHQIGTLDILMNLSIWGL